MNLRPRPSRAGFTLIELLVVISIIALLISILLPSLGSARRTAKVIQCLSGVKQIGMAQSIYSDDYSGHFTSQNYLDGNKGVSHDELLAYYDGRNGINEVEALNPDMRQEGELDSELWRCPLEVLPHGWGVPENSFGRAPRSYAMTLGEPFESRRQNPNAWAAQRYTGVTRANAPWITGERWSAKQDELRDPSSTIVLSDYAAVISFQGWPNGGEFSLVGAVGANNGYYGSPGFPNGPSRFYAHENKVGADPLPSAAFADGHAATVSIKEELESVGSSYANPIAVGTRFDALK